MHPETIEFCGDEIDNDCDGVAENQDYDGDGRISTACGAYGFDCNDSNAGIYRGKTEICSDGIDQDCSGADVKCGDPDNDKDGYREVDGDCDDTLKAIFPGAKEKCGDFVDQNCDGYEKVCVEALPTDIFDRVFPEIEKPDGSWSPIGAWSPLGLENLRKAEQWVASLVSTLTTATDKVLAPTESNSKNVILSAPDAQKQEYSVILSAPVVTTTGSEGSQYENNTGVDRVAFTTPPTIGASSPASTDQYAPAEQNSKAGFSTTTVALYYTFGDHLGSSSVTLDASGNLVQATDYFPYGGANVDEKYGSFAQPYTYTGKELDSEVDLYYYGARYYNAGFSRFTSVDPALFDAGYLQSSLSDPQRLNSYSYSKNNPVKYVDPNGGVPLLAFIIKGGINAGADWFMQTAMNYFFNPGTAGDLSASAAAVNGWQVARSGAEGLLPWKTPGGRLGRAAVTAIGDVMANYLHYGDDYSMEQAMLDFGVGFIGDLGGGGLGELISKYGSKAVARGLGNMGFNYQAVMKFMGGGIKQISKTHNGITATRMMGGWADGKTAVIGRVGKSVNRVKSFAEGISGAEIWGGFDENLPYETNLANNNAWVQKLKDEGYTIYDVGLAPGQTDKGDFYGMETQEIFGD